MQHKDLGKEIASKKLQTLFIRHCQGYVKRQGALLLSGQMKGRTERCGGRRKLVCIPCVRAHHRDMQGSGYKRQNTSILFNTPLLTLLFLFIIIFLADRIVFWFLNKNLFQHFFSPNSVFFSLPTPFSFLYFSQCLLLFFSFTLVSLIALLTTRIGLTKRHFFSLLFPPLIFVIVCPAQYYLVGLLAVWSRQAWLLIGIAAQQITFTAAWIVVIFKLLKHHVCNVL